MQLHNLHQQIMQIGEADNCHFVKLFEHKNKNIYKGKIIEFQSNDYYVATDRIVEVINIAEKVSTGGVLPLPTELICFEIEGHYLTYVSAENSSLIPAKIAEHITGYKYRVIFQKLDQNANFVNIDNNKIEAMNIAEHNIGPGGAIDNNTIVMVSKIRTSDFPDGKYIFSHPTYAKYMN